MTGLMPPGPLSYSGQVAVAYIQRPFAPTTSDINFNVGTIWLYPSAKLAYILVNKALGVADWQLFATSAGPIDTITTGDGNVLTPIAGNITIANGNNISSVGNSGTGTATLNLTGTTQHAVQIGNASGSLSSLPLGTSGYVLTSNGAGSDPSWQANTGMGITTISADNSGTATGTTVLVSGGSTGLTTIASGSTLSLTGVLALSHGGTNANLTASNGGIFYSTASAGAILAGTATAHQLLLSGASSAPIWSTSTYPTTNAVNTLLYASSTNVMAALATANDGVLVTSNSGVPSWLANSATPGYVLTANSGAPPSWQASSASGAVTTINGDSGSMTPTAGVVTIGGGSTGLTTLASASTMTLTGDLNVAHGGTGNTTFTAYSVICAGTTATGAFQNVSGLGTAGYVLTSNGAGALPTWQVAASASAITGITVDTSTAPGTNPVLPSSGLVKFTGAAPISAGTNSFGLQFQSLAANTTNLSLQLAQANATSQTTGFGISQYNSTQFGVTGGFVTANNFTINTGAGLSGGGTITLGGSLTLTASGLTFTWTDQSTSFSAAINNGYFVTATATATLPTTPAQGSEIQFAVDSASGKLTIQAPAGASIRLGSTVSATGGTAVSSKDGDSISLVYRVSDLTWIAISSIGQWNVT